jgi:hypothetical protein
MHEAYEDITSQLGEPGWYDECAVPRYCPFSPSRLADVYADECVLLEIACQECGRRFRVAMSESACHRAMCDLGDLTLRKGIEDGWLHYGDPPHHQGDGNGAPCYAGATMNCDDLAVLEYWCRDGRREWTRIRGLEGPLGVRR